MKRFDSQTLSLLKQLLKCTVLILALMGPITWGQTRTMAHFAQDTAGFLNVITVSNTSTETTTYSLSGFRIDGSLVAEASGELQVGQTLTETPQDLFSSLEVAYATLEDNPSLLAGVSYTTLGTGWNSFFWDTTSSARWRLYPIDPSQFFDGVVIINPALVPLDITISQIDGAGNLIASQVFNLEAKYKLLLVLSNLFAPISQSHYGVEADQPIIVQGLRGDLSSSGVWENPALALPTEASNALPRMLTHFPPDASLSQVIVANTASLLHAFTLTSYDAVGNETASLSAEVGPGQTVYYALETLFPGASVSHCSVVASDEVVVSHARLLDGEPEAQFHEKSQWSSSWWVPNCNGCNNVEALTLVNSSQGPLDVYLRKLDPAGNLISETEVCHNLPANGKWIQTVEVPAGAGHLELIGNRDFVFQGLGLQGYLWEKQGRPLQTCNLPFFLKHWADGTTTVNTLIPLVIAAPCSTL